jgi:hypothetical protein
MVCAAPCSTWIVGAACEKTVSCWLLVAGGHVLLDYPAVRQCLRSAVEWLDGFDDTVDYLP